MVPFRVHRGRCGSALWIPLVLLTLCSHGLRHIPIPNLSLERAGKMSTFPTLSPFLSRMRLSVGASELSSDPTFSHIPIFPGAGQKGSAVLLFVGFNTPQLVRAVISSSPNSAGSRFPGIPLSGSIFRRSVNCGFRSLQSAFACAVDRCLQLTRCSSFTRANRSSSACLRSPSPSLRSWAASFSFS
jgi:hypothetical protein